MMIKVFIGEESIHNIEIERIKRDDEVGTDWYLVIVDGGCQGIYPSKTSAAMGIADYIFDYEVSFH